MNFKTMLRVGQDNTVIENNQFRAEDTAGAGKGISIWSGVDYLTVKNNFFYGQFDTVGDTSNVAGAISVDVAHDSGDTIISGLNISGNKIVSTDTASGLLINLGNGAVSPIRGLV